METPEGRRLIEVETLETHRCSLSYTPRSLSRGEDALDHAPHRLGPRHDPWKRKRRR